MKFDRTSKANTPNWAGGVNIFSSFPISVHCDISGADLGAIGLGVGILLIAEELPFAKYLALFAMELVLTPAQNNTFKIIRRPRLQGDCSQPQAQTVSVCWRESGLRHRFRGAKCSKQ